LFVTPIIDLILLPFIILFDGRFWVEFIKTGLRAMVVVTGGVGIGTALSMVIGNKYRAQNET